MKLRQFFPTLVSLNEGEGDEIKNLFANDLNVRHNDFSISSTCAKIKEVVEKIKNVERFHASKSLRFEFWLSGLKFVGSFPVGGISDKTQFIQLVIWNKKGSLKVLRSSKLSNIPLLIEAALKDLWNKRRNELLDV